MLTAEGFSLVEEWWVRDPGVAARTPEDGTENE
jgi:hypothetical protein